MSGEVVSRNDKAANPFVDDADENQEKGRQMEAAEQRRAAALRAGDLAAADRETRQIAAHAVDVPKAQANGISLTRVAKGQIQLLRQFNAAKYTGLKGHIKDVNAGQNGALRSLWADAQFELEAVRDVMQALAKFSKSGDAQANPAIEAALQHATIQCRILSDIMNGK